MTTDAWLAIAHHLAAFTLLAIIVAEFVLVRPGLHGVELQRLRRFDALYGVTAGVVLIVGISRLIWGAKPFDFYGDNPFFWLKMAAFATVGLLSIRPTMRYLRWTAAGEEAGEPDPDEIRQARHLLVAQLSVFAVIPVCAALMARGIGT